MGAQQPPHPIEPGPAAQPARRREVPERVSSRASLGSDRAAHPVVGRDCQYALHLC